MGEFASRYCRMLSIGPLIVSSNVLMAPMCGATDAAFRRKVQALGAGIAFTEMVYVEDLLRRSPRALEAARFDPQEPIRALQLIGHDPKAFRRLCESPLIELADLIDVNMGCAVPEIAGSGRGCALVHDLPLAARVIEACKASGKPVTVKCRPGMNLEQDWLRPFVRMCEDSGVDMLTVHGRPGERQHEGPVLYEVIAEAKASVRIPVIGNGGIFSEEDALEMMEQTGADGVMIGRYGLARPEIFSELTNM